MPFIPTPLGLEVVVVQELYGEEVLNVLHFEQAATMTGNEIDAAGAAISAAIIGNIVPVMGVDWAYKGLKLRQLDEEGGLVGSVTVISGGQGPQNVDLAPANVALVLTKRSNRAGRSYRGRMFVPGVQLDAADRNLAAGAWAASVAAAWNDFIIEVEGPRTLFFAVLSKQHNKVWRTEGVLTRISSLELRNRRVDTQRRRLPDE